MPDFDIDSLKKSWQEQEVKSQYESNDILNMLNKKSRNYVMYILWISVLEFIFLLGINIWYVINSDEQSSFLKIIEKIGLKQTDEITRNFEHLYLIMKFAGLLITAFFVYRFYTNYRSIKIEENLKKLISRIITFKNTVNAFIITNISLLIGFSVILIIYIIYQIEIQNLEISNATLAGFIVGSIIGILMSFLLIWIYYKIIYGIIMKRLAKNLQQLKEIENETE